MSSNTQPDNAVLERPAPRRTPAVLCIDDDPQVSEVIHDWLAVYEVKLLKAFFGTQGIWMAVTQTPDVIITDLRMPRGDGATVIECLKRKPQTAAIPVIVLTARVGWQGKSTITCSAMLESTLRISSACCSAISG